MPGNKNSIDKTHHSGPIKKHYIYSNYIMIIRILLKVMILKKCMEHALYSNYIIIIRILLKKVMIIKNVWNMPFILIIL